MDAKCWREFLSNAIGKAKQQLQSSYALEDDGSGPPNRVAIRRLIDALPCPVKVLELRVDRMRHTHLHDDVCPLLIYDLSKLGDPRVEWLGIADAYDPGSLRKILIEQHGIQMAEEFIENLQQDAKLVGLWETKGSPISLQFLFYDPRTDSRQFMWDLVMHLESSIREILPPPGPPVDYKSLYGLQPEPVVPVQQLMQPDPRTRTFSTWKETGFGPLTVEELQRRVNNWLLIPKVPEEVMRVFDRARQLYVFGFFRYEFFTVSEHLAYLSLESAIKHKYCQGLGETVVLRTKEGRETTLHRPDYERIRRQWWEEGRHLMVNEEPFLSSMPQLLDRLVRDGVITKWERKKCKGYLEMRNFFAHPTFASIHPPGDASAALGEVSSLINKMFHHGA